MSYEYSTPKTATVKMGVAVTAEGYLAGQGDTPAGQKNFNIQGVKTSATLDESAAVFDAFVTDIAGGTFDSTTATKTVTYFATEVAENPEP